MDLFDVLRACARRWFVFIPLLAITIAVAYSNYSNVKLVYFGNVSVGLTAPSTKVQQTSSTSPVIVNTNGLVDAGGVEYLASLLSTEMEQPSTKDAVNAAGGTVGYSSTVFTAPAGTQIPILVISASGTSATEVQNSLRAAASQASPVLDSIQADAGVPSASRYRALTPSDIPVPGGSYPSRTRQGVATVLGGLLLTVVITVAADSVIQTASRRRSKNATRRGGADPHPEPDPKPDPVTTDSSNGRRRRRESTAP